MVDRRCRQKSKNLIQKMSSANPGWGAPRLHGELQKLGIHLAQATVAKYMVCHRKPPSQTWRIFLENHAKELVSTDFFVVPTATFGLLFVFLVLSHDRRRLLHFGVTSHPTAEWTARQLVQAFPWNSAPRYLLPIATEFMASRFRQPPIRWGFKRCSPLLIPRGKILIASVCAPKHPRIRFERIDLANSCGIVVSELTPGPTPISSTLP